MKDLRQKLLAKYPEHSVYKDYLIDLFASLGKDAVVVEVGCNEMQDTIRLLDLLESPRFYGFEPDPDFYHCFEYVEGATILPVAIGAKDGFANFYQSKLSDGSNPGSSSIRKPKNHLKIFSHVSFPNAVEVEMLSLDSFAQKFNINHIDFIWADIQGAEIDLIKGGQKILASTDYLFTEYSNGELYDGQAGLDNIIDALPGTWTVVHDYVSDVLLKREV